MFDHLGLRVRQLAPSREFYAAVLAPLGLGLQSQGEDYAGFGPPDAPALWLHAQPQGPGSAVHVAFRAPSAAAVQAFHTAGLAAGARSNGAPGPRPDYGDGYFAAFLLDPDGNNVEAVFLPR